MKKSAYVLLSACLALSASTLFAQPRAGKSFDRDKAKPSDTLRIFTLGDSNGTFADSWPVQLQKAYPKAKLFNISKSGRTIGFVNNGDSTLNSLFVIKENLRKAIAHAQGKPYQFIILQLGTNDAKAVFANRQNEVADNLERLVREINTNPDPVIGRAKIIIVSPPPYGAKTERTEKYKGGDARVKAMSEAFAAIAKRNGCLFVNGYSTPRLNMEAMSTDGLHLDAFGSRLLMEPVVQLIAAGAPAQALPQTTLTSVKATAPFDMPAITIPDFSKCARFTITAFGAVKGDKEKNAAAIAAAITSANEAGGGTVVIPEGEWLTKALHFKSNVNLHLEKGAVLLFSDKPEDYLPAVHSTWEGIECYNYSPLIYAYNCKNIAITGEGNIKALMNTWQQWFTRPPAHMESIKRVYNWSWNDTPVVRRNMVNDTSHLRPQLIQINRSENILLEGFSITNSPFWTIHPYLCQNVVIRKLKVYAHGHNNDGVDPEMSQNVLIDSCEFDQGDDAVAIKSGRNPEGWRTQTPSKNIIISNCKVKNGHQLVAIGSELSGGIEKVFITNCQVEQGAKLSHLLFIKTNERMGGYVKDIYASHLSAGKIEKGILGIETDVLYQWKTLVPTYEKRLTPISNIHIDWAKATDVEFVVSVHGQKELPVKNVLLNNVTATQIRVQREIYENAENAVLRN